MKRASVVATLSVLLAGVLLTLPVWAQGQPPVVIDVNAPNWSRDHGPLETTSYTTTVNAVGAGPFYVGDQNLGNVIVGPVDRDQEQALNWGRCRASGAPGPAYNAAVTWCDGMELLVQNVPEDAPWNVQFTLSWPGKSFIDPATKNEVKFNNLDFYFGLDEIHRYVWEDDCELTINSGIVPGVSSRGQFHPEFLNVADLLPTGKERAEEVPKKLVLGGCNTVDAVWNASSIPINDSPACPVEIATNPDLQPTACPKIIDHQLSFKYYLLVISRIHTRDLPKFNEDYLNKGYTITTELTVYKDDEELVNADKDNFIAFDSDTGLFEGDLDPESTLPRAKEPGADGPAATHGLFALKGLAAKAKSGNNPLVYGIITTVLVALVGSALFFIVRRRRGLSGGSSA